MSKANDLTKNYSGIFGNKVMLRNRNGKSIMTIPLKRLITNPTESQVNARRRFQLAARYAKNVLHDPEKLVAYTSKSHDNLSPYILALTDYLKLPTVEEVNASGYQGKPGDKINVTAIDDFNLTAVTIKILDPQNDVIEEGPCVFNLGTGNYDFTATVLVPDLDGVTIIAKATDTPGHSAESSMIL